MEKISVNDLFQPDEWWWWLALPFYLVLAPLTIPVTLIWFLVEEIF